MSLRGLDAARAEGDCSGFARCRGGCRNRSLIAPGESTQQIHLLSVKIVTENIWDE